IDGVRNFLTLAATGTEGTAGPSVLGAPAGVSDLLYLASSPGGLMPGDVEALQNALSPTGTIVATYGTLGSRTDEASLDAARRLLGVRWFGWNVRYFKSL